MALQLNRDEDSNSPSRNSTDDNSLDYILNEDGSCTCKLCGEQVSTRTHWYRHKYKVHNVALFRCEKCEIFFKSKKGYEGHLANKHAPKVLGEDGKPKTKKEVEGLNKVMSLNFRAKNVKGQKHCKSRKLVCFGILSRFEFSRLRL